MKIVQILGGLGNQMFQYAFLTALRESSKDEVLMDTSLFDTYPLHNGFELDKIFKITAEKATDAEVHKVYWPFFTHSYRVSQLYRNYMPQLKTECREDKHCIYNEDILKYNGDIYYDGYWQNYKYFDKHIDVVRREFEYIKPLSGMNLEFSGVLNNKMVCSLHIRRGDYLKDKLYTGLCGIDYYIKSINDVLSKFDDITFAIFSNDLIWCKDNIYPIIGSNNIIEVDWNRGADSYNDMRLMSLCPINIIANSSFSWWAAYLNSNDNKAVYAPEKWVNLDWRFKYQPDDWILY